jgi:SAM-dependent methyltransferase
MAMNLCHRLRCSSSGWAVTVQNQLLPWALADVDLGHRALEIGPGYGATLRALLDRAPSITAIEVDSAMAARLNRRYGGRAHIIHGDGAQTGLPDGQFSSVVCFTMLHHVPTAHLQDQLFREAFRVLEPGGVFAGSDGVPSMSFRLKHIGDTYNPLTPDDLNERLCRVGFTDVQIDVAGTRQRWRAFKPVAEMTRKAKQY